MIFRLFRRDPQAATIAALYGAIVAQARNPSFYLGFGVPDTAEGRFDMILLHLALFWRRLGRESATPGSLGQDVFDMFCRDMDHNLREMGVGDLSVPKKMQKMAAAFYGRLETYDRALAMAGDDDLAVALARNVLGEAAPSGSARRLAAYARLAARRFDEIPVAGLTGETLRFPDPDTIPAPAGEPHHEG
jgi:cytochrome b pre-mRNA-processing protein 3